jgi:hypothetical protein
MDTPDYKRRSKKDKAKEKFQRNGGKSSHHVRNVEALQEKQAKQAKQTN